MKRLVVVLVLVSTPVWAGWTSVGDNNAGTVYADADTIVRNGNTARMWSLLDYKAFQRMVEVGYFSQKTQTEYDCAERRARGISLLLYAEHMGAGKVIYADESPHDWESLAADPITENLRTVACKR